MFSFQLKVCGEATECAEIMMDACCKSVVVRVFNQQRTDAVFSASSGHKKENNYLITRDE